MTSGMLKGLTEHTKIAKANEVTKHAEASEKVLAEVKGLVQEVSKVMEKDLDARKELEASANYDDYFKSSQEAIKVMRKIRLYLKGNSIDVDFELEEMKAMDKYLKDHNVINELQDQVSGTLQSIAALREYLKYQGISRGPMTFDLLNDSVPAVRFDVEKILAEFNPPKSLGPDVGTLESSTPTVN